MPTTTVRVPDELRARIARAAKHAGTTPHALMLEALEARVELEEARAAMVAEAVERDGEWTRTRRGYAWGDVREYVSARAEGQKVPRPRMKTWPK